MFHNIHYETRFKLDMFRIDHKLVFFTPKKIHFKKTSTDVSYEFFLVFKFR